MIRVRIAVSTTRFNSGKLSPCCILPFSPVALSDDRECSQSGGVLNPRGMLTMSNVTKPAEELLEGWGDVVATNDSGWLNDYDSGSGYGTTLARYQRPATTLFDRADGRFLPIYQTEFDLAVIRAMGRTLAQVSPALVGAVRSMCNYTIGQGFTFSASRDDTADWSSPEAKQIVYTVQKEINTLLDDTDFVGAFDREIHNSSIEDGEVFLHIRPSGCGSVQVSRCDPDQIRQPAATRELEDWIADAFGIACEEFVSSWSFGIHTRSNEPEVALGYHVVSDEAGVNWEYIPASRMVHIKRNVPRSAKRGFSDFFPIEADSTRGEKLRRNMAEGAAVQSAIAYVRQHLPGVTRTGVEQMLGEIKVGTNQQPFSGGGSRSRSVVQYRPGTVVDLSAGLEYKPGPMGSDRANDFMVVAQYVQRMQAVRWSMPEYMFTGDASNANYSSTLVAESPFVKSCEAEQRFYARHFVAVLWKALRIRWELGAFERFGVTWQELEQLIEIKAECPAVATRDELANVQRQEILIRLGLLSRKSAASQNGLDYEAEVALGAAPEGQSGGGGASTGSARPTGAPEVPQGVAGLSEETLLECGGKGGKPGPCPKHLPKTPKKGHRSQNQVDDQTPHQRASGTPMQSDNHRPGGPDNPHHADHSRSAKSDEPAAGISEPLTSHTEPTVAVVTGESKTAVRNSNPNTKDRQLYAKTMQDHLAREVGGMSVGNNAPADVAVSGGFLEAKTKLDGKRDGIHMTREAIERKAKVSAETGHPFHTVAMDKRHQYLRGANGHDHDPYPMYYKRGAGSFHLSEMEVVRDAEHLQELLAMSDDELPPAARPTAEWKATVKKAKTWQKKGHLKGQWAIAAQRAATDRSNT